MSRFVLACSLAMLTPGAWTAPKKRYPGDEINAIRQTWETPHTAFARPWALGRLRVLAITVADLPAREIAELAQRLDVDVDVFLMFDSTRMASGDRYSALIEGTSVEEKRRELRTKLAAKHDAIILGNVRTAAIPAELRYMLFRAVSNGAGLVVCNHQAGDLKLLDLASRESADAEWIIRGVPFHMIRYYTNPLLQERYAALPLSDVPKKLIETRRVGRGRVCLLKYGHPHRGRRRGGRSLTPLNEGYHPNGALQYDYALAAVARAVLWAARRLPRWRIAEPLAERMRIKGQELPAARPIVLTGPAKETFDGQLHLRMRLRSGHVVVERRYPVKIAGGRAAVSVTIPHLPRGGFLADQTLRSGRGVEDWYSGYFVIDRAKVWDQADLPERFLKEGQAAELRVQMAKTAPPGAAVTLEVRDTFYHRVVMRQSKPAAPGAAVSFALPTREVCAIMHNCVVECRGKERLLDRWDGWFAVPHYAKRRRRFRSIIWGGTTYTGHINRFMYRRLREAGFEACLGAYTRHGIARAENDLLWVPYVTRLQANKKGNRSWHDLSYSRAMAKQYSRYGVMFYSLGDENRMSYYRPVGSHELGAFREFVKGRYRDLDELNRVWGTNYATFDQVESTAAGSCTRAELWPRGHDSQAFMEEDYARLHETHADAIRGHAPDAKVGAEGSDSGEMLRTIRDLEVWAPYRRLRTDVLVRSVGRDRIRGGWWGGYVHTNDIYRNRNGRDGCIVLDELLRGHANASFFFAAMGTEGMFTPDLAFQRYYQALRPTLEHIRGGMGQLLAEVDEAGPVVAVHYSPSNEHAGRMHRAFGAPDKAGEALFKALDFVGIQYRYVTDQQIENGQLVPARYPAFFMLCSQAIAEAEAERIRQYAGAGGLVIADIVPAIMEARCVARLEGHLNGLFGVKRSGAPKAKTRPIKLDGRLRGTTVSFASAQSVADASLTLAPGARQLGEGLGFVREHGKGCAVLLNFALAQAFERVSDPAQRWRLIESLLAAHGIKPRCRVAKHRAAYHLKEWRVHTLELLAVLPVEDEPPADAVALSAKRHVYDSRSGEHVGETSRIELRGDGAWPRLFAILPGPAGRIEVQCPSSTRPEQPVAVRASLVNGPIPPAGRVLRLEVRDAKGREIRALRDYAKLTSARCTFIFRAAHNDPPGPWTVRVVDAATGIAGEAPLRVDGLR